MKQFFAFLIFCTTLLFSAQSFAQEITTAPQTNNAGFSVLQLALLEPVQWPEKEKDVKGLSLNLLYGAKNNMYGVDLGLVSKINGDFKGYNYGGISMIKGSMYGIQNNFIVSMADGDVKGIQSALYTQAKTLTGIQFGIANITKEKARGVQIGYYMNYAKEFSGLQLAVAANITQELKGMQLGIFNYAKKAKGLQFGLVNVTDNLCGLQIGLANINNNGDPLVFFPLINFSSKW